MTDMREAELSQCEACNGWGYDDVWGFALSCPRCDGKGTVKQSLTLQPVSNSYTLVEAIMDVGPIGCCNIDEQYAEKILSLMQPEIDRRVAEERAKLLERLREPSEGFSRNGNGLRPDRLLQHL
jgi:hypothetical protein